MMKLPALAPGLTQLLKTELTLPISKKRFVHVKDVIFFRNPYQVAICDRLPLARLIRELGTGPFVVLRIVHFPTKSICFDFFDKQGEFRRINTSYFTKGAFIRRYWKTYWMLWKCFCSLRKFFYK